MTLFLPKTATNPKITSEGPPVEISKLCICRASWLKYLLASSCPAKRAHQHVRMAAAFYALFDGRRRQYLGRPLSSFLVRICAGHFAYFDTSWSGISGTIVFIGEWINEFERQSFNRRNPYVLEPLMAKNVLAARDSPCINALT